MTAPHEAHNLRPPDPDRNTFPVPIETPSTTPRLTSSAVSNLHHGQHEARTELQADVLLHPETFATADPATASYFLYGSKTSDETLGHPPQLTQLGRQSISNTGNVDISGRSVTNLASFGAQPWLATSNPFLEFAPQHTYELTGELLDEEEQQQHHQQEEDDDSNFANFNSPFTFTGHGASPLQNTQVSPTPPQEVRPTSTATDSGPNPNVVPFQQSLLRSALKRKAAAVDSALSPDTAKRIQPGTNSTKATVRTVSFGSMSAPGSSSEDGPTSPETSNASRAMQANVDVSRPQTGTQTTSGQPSTLAAARLRSARRLRETSGQPAAILPKEKVFPIQIGSELFRLSGASLSSDAPSYFTHFFEEQLRQHEDSGGVRTLYIDRDPGVFREIARHLQGYHIKPLDGSHFVKLFADAQFYHLPRLIDQLFESEIFIQVGDRHFQIPKDIFSDAGNTPNFFSLGFAIFFSNPGDAFQSIDRKGLLRPPSITPPYVAGRSADIFFELVQLLRGYPLHIQNEAHRASLLRDCRYFHLRGLEQKLIAHEISYNLERDRTEISLRLEDIKPSGISFKAEEDSTPSLEMVGWINYARPFVDDHAYELVIEISGETLLIDLNRMRVDFRGLTKSRVQSLLQVIANKMNLPTTTPLGLVMLAGGSAAQANTPTYAPLSEDQVKVRFEEASHISLDGEGFEIEPETALGRRLLTGPPHTEESRGSPSTGTEIRDRTRPLSPPPLPRATSSSSQTKRQPVRPLQRPPGATSTTVPALPPAVLPPSESGGISTAPGSPTRKRKRVRTDGAFGKWIVRSGQWRLKIRSSMNDAGQNTPELIFVAVKIDAYTSERARNTNRGYLGP